MESPEVMEKQSFILQPTLVRLLSSAVPAWVWSTERRCLVWANPAGLTYWGARRLDQLVTDSARSPRPGLRRLAELARDLPRPLVRIERLRLSEGAGSTVLTCRVAWLDQFVGQYILVSALNTASGQGYQAEPQQIAEILLDCVSERALVADHTGEILAQRDFAKWPGWYDSAKNGLRDMLPKADWQIVSIHQRPEDQLNSKLRIAPGAMAPVQVRALQIEQSRYILVSLSGQAAPHNVAPHQTASSEEINTEMDAAECERVDRADSASPAAPDTEQRRESEPGLEKGATAAIVAANKATVAANKATSADLADAAETVAETEAPETAETVAETEAPETAETVAETEAPETTEIIAETEAPDAAEIIAETEAPDAAEIIAETEAPETAEIAAEAEAPDAAEIIAETEAPETAEIAAEDEAPETAEIIAEAEAPETAEIIAETEAPETAEIIAEAEAPDAAEIIAETEAPETAEIAAEDEAPDAAEIIAETEAPETAEIAAEDEAPETAEIIAEDETPETAEIIAEDETPETAEIIAETEAPETAEIAAEDEAPETAEIIAEDETPETAEIIAEDETPETAEIIAETEAPETAEIIAEAEAPETAEIIAEAEAPEAAEIVAETVAEDEAPDAAEIIAETVAEDEAPDAAEIIAGHEDTDDNPENTSPDKSAACTPSAWARAAAMLWRQVKPNPAPNAPAMVQQSSPDDRNAEPHPIAPGASQPTDNALPRGADRPPAKAPDKDSDDAQAQSLVTAAYRTDRPDGINHRKDPDPQQTDKIVRLQAVRPSEESATLPREQGGVETTHPPHRADGLSLDRYERDAFNELAAALDARLKNYEGDGQSQKFEKEIAPTAPEEYVEPAESDKQPRIDAHPSATDMASDDENAPDTDVDDVPDTDQSNNPLTQENMLAEHPRGRTINPVVENAIAAVSANLTAKTSQSVAQPADDANLEPTSKLDLEKLAVIWSPTWDEVNFAELSAETSREFLPLSNAPNPASALAGFAHIEPENEPAAELSDISAISPSEITLPELAAPDPLTDHDHVLGSEDEPDRDVAATDRTYPVYREFPAAQNIDVGADRLSASGEQFDASEVITLVPSKDQHDDTLIWPTRAEIAAEAESVRDAVHDFTSAAPSKLDHPPRDTLRDFAFRRAAISQTGDDIREAIDNETTIETELERAEWRYRSQDNLPPEDPAFSGIDEAKPLSHDPKIVSLAERAARAGKSLDTGQLADQKTEARAGQLSDASEHREISERGAFSGPGEISELEQDISEHAHTIFELGSGTSHADVGSPPLTPDNRRNLHRSRGDVARASDAPPPAPEDLHGNEPRPYPVSRPEPADEPSAATDDPAITADEPSAATDDPTATTDEPSAATDDPATTDGPSSPPDTDDTPLQTRVEALEDAPLPADQAPSQYATMSAHPAPDTRVEPVQSSHIIEAALPQTSLSALAEISSDGLVLLRGDGRVDFANKRAFDLLLGADQDLVGRSVLDLVDEESAAQIETYLDRCAAGHLVPAKEQLAHVYARFDQNQEMPLSVQLGLVDSTPQAHYAQFIDHSEIRQQEQEFSQALAREKDANRNKSELISAISHEIRTPLNSIIGFTEMIMSEQFGPLNNDRYRGYVSDIHDSGSHLLQLVGDLHDLTRIESGRVEMDFARIAVSDLIRDVIRMMQPAANKARIIIRSSLAPGGVAVVADRRSLRQICLNLISNAIQYTKPGGQVIISSTVTEDGEVKIKVRDTGPGMTAEQVTAATQPLARRGSPEVKLNMSSGMGLPLTSALAEANRAHFELSSKLNEGTLAEITFPLTRVLSS